tara:strand:- start:291 stop:431 length:141 start_codon:yes stop_codon:yes gene_type:complete
VVQVIHLRSILLKEIQEDNIQMLVMMVLQVVVELQQQEALVVQVDH